MRILNTAIAHGTAEEKMEPHRPEIPSALLQRLEALEKTVIAIQESVEQVRREKAKATPPDMNPIVQALERLEQRIQTIEQETPGPALMPVSKSALEEHPVIDPEPEPAPAPDPMPASEPVPEPGPPPKFEPVVESASELNSELEFESKSEPAQEPEPEPEPAPRLESPPEPLPPIPLLAPKKGLWVRLWRYLNHPAFD
jgi:hypothetical protein